MIKKLYPSFLFLAILFSATGAFGQSKQRVIRAKVVDTKGIPVEFVTAAVFLNGPDSSVVKSMVTGKDGLIDIGGLSNGSYRLLVAQLGLKARKELFTLSDAKPTADLGTLTMENEVRNLKEVNVAGEKIPVVIKKDTIELNAGSYKTQKNDNVEQLFKKLPGVDVDKDGKITAQGKEVTKVLVDGKEFFGNDPKAVTKNLPADAIDKVQIIDDKTEKAKSTGIDDGQREKVMNVTLKADKKKGWFGNMAAAGGNNSRYLGQFNMNRFDNKKQFAILSLSNNVNEAGFAFEDINAFVGTNGFGGLSDNQGTSINISANGRANVNGAFSGVEGGLITNHTAGVNYSDELGKKGQFKFNTNFVAVLSDNVLNQRSNLQDIPNGLLTNQFTNGNNTINSYRFAVSAEYKPDTLNTIRFKPSMGLGIRKNYNSTASGTTRLTADSVNSISQLLDQTMRNPFIGGSLSLNHLFQKGKGSVNLFTTGNYSESNVNYINRSTTRFFVSSMPGTDLNQQASVDNDGSFITSTASFVRQISKAKKINFNVSQSADFRRQNVDQYTVDYDAVTGNYEIFDPLYSGNSANRSHRLTSTAGLNKTADSYTVNFNLAMAHLALDGSSFSNNLLNNVHRDTWAFVPNASFTYRQKNGRSVSFGVNTDVALPTATNLQTVFNNTNPLYIRQGNPDLVPSRSYGANASYNYFDAKTNAYINFFGSYTVMTNGFSTESSVSSGITTSRPLNVDGNYSTNLGINFSQPTKIKGLKYSINTYFNASKNVNFINGNRNEVVTLRPSLGTGGSIDREKYQFNLRVYGTLSSTKNSFQSLADRKFYTFYNTVGGSVSPNKTWRIFTDMTQNLFRGQPAGANNSVYLWNAGIERYFLDSKNLTLSVNAFDLLNQNSGISRTVNSTGVLNNNQTNTIGQYFYLKLIYKITRVGAQTNNNGVIIMK
ncbi:TonB-dependent receptor [Mucilaginibacter myungsuensis]|uniref:Outer membrane beta-barrel protein n=1 Tax=Mucilaginibacter myungsuensis TaxID=649104 RepID=A0A929KZE1_9SPHI|nr:TonB-dependent receptor [Mucilaginibacter myungsuensis]MBE9661679.1 outer membrane beta-barrel protein [Mucilaginibacter myungsuensis]MDN3597823.1 TonB-dependent receptor [Mucilaginibacter myungsuensis]